MDTSGHMSLCEDYVSFEIAKLLKEKGFDEATFYNYNERGTRWFEEVLVNHNSQGGVACPTLQMAMKWLREVHGLFIGVVFQLECLSKEDKWFWKWNIYDKRNKFALVEFGESDTYEKACEAAIKYCLENLI